MPVTTGLLRRGRTAVDAFRHLVRWYEPEEKIVRDAQAYWDAPPSHKRDLYAHWRSGFNDPATWLAIGQKTCDLFRTFAPIASLTLPVKRVVEWGAGGGANAVHFGRIADEFYGVDITQQSLDECGRQMRAEGLDNFKPVRITVETPESALDLVPRDCDLFTCFYVFELFPTPEYGERIMRIASQLLRPGGMAIIQIKYSNSLRTRSRRWGYRFGVANMTTYHLDHFWEICKASGLQPVAVTLSPRDELVNDERYAYFILQKR